MRILRAFANAMERNACAMSLSAPKASTNQAILLSSISTQPRMQEVEACVLPLPSLSFTVCVGPMFSIFRWFCVVLLISASLAEVRAEFGEYRSIFVDRFDFPYSGGSIASHTATINQMMQNAADEGFSEVVWQVRGRADALYNSNFEPAVNGLTPGFDPLQTAITAAHARGLKIHAWFNATPMWNTTAINPPTSPISHIYHNTNPSFRIRDINGNLEPQDGWSNYSSVNPILPEVHTHINNVINDVATNYNVDGIHLDYIRYLPGGYNFDRFPHDTTSHQMFFNATGLDGSNPANEAAYKSYIESRITDLVASVKQTVDAAEVSTGRAMELSASVWRDPDVGKNDYMQDYRTWMENDYLDVVMPMIYLSATNDETFFNANLLNTMSVNTNTRVVPTLASYLHDNPGGGGVELTLSQVERANLMRADGVNFYDYPAYFGGYSNADRTVLKNYFDAQSDPNLGSLGNVLDDFEAGEGHFNASITYSGTTTGILAGSTATRVTTEAQAGIASQQLDINGDPSFWLLRHVSGFGSPGNNEDLDATGYIGVWLKTDDPGITVEIGLDDPASADRGFKQPLIADGQWHLYQWNLEDDYQWKGWINGDGDITGPTVTVDSIFFEGAGDATIFMDNVSHNPLEIISSPVIDGGPGDFDGDGDVDGDDLAQWEGDYGLNGDSDANDDGLSSGLDFLIWQQNSSGASPLSAVATVPEPASLLLTLSLPLLLASRIRLAIAQ